MSALLHILIIQIELTTREKGPKLTHLISLHVHAGAVGWQMIATQGTKGIDVVQKRIM